MSGIRVIAGKAKGRRLSLVPGDSTRPITDRVKENLFNILGPSIVGMDVLDAFAGTGSVGIEALSRGAQFARFLDKDRRAVRTIHQNLSATGLIDQAEVLHRDAFPYLKKGPDRSFDLVYIAPPQYKEMWAQALRVLDEHSGWLAPGGQVVVQIDPREYVPAELIHFNLVDERKYGNTLLLFYST